MKGNTSSCSKNIHLYSSKSFWGGIILGIALTVILSRILNGFLLTSFPEGNNISSTSSNLFGGKSEVRETVRIMMTNPELHDDGNPQTTWPSSEFGEYTVAACPPSCPTRNLMDARPKIRTNLTEEQFSFWRQNGYLALPGFFTKQRIAQANRAVDKAWETRKDPNSPSSKTVVDYYIGTHNEVRAEMSSAPDDAYALPMKINDLYLDSPEIRHLSLDEQLTRILSELLGFTPVLLNTLNFKFGSQQRFHFDTWYMPPPTQDQMVATWIALDDVNSNNGPLMYYPGSHTLKPYIFSNGKLNQVQNELDTFDQYIAKELKRTGLKPIEFHAKAGDVFIWHAQLYHGGKPIVDYNQTRRALVSHYFSTLDFPLDQKRIVPVTPGEGSYYIRPKLQIGRRW